ncbi:hypothetical protein AMS62_24810 [Bacillus sp. FJAT-18019]|nr:hypothetical protein AMS62_24810 [Bacillus sp. FJAT-18019]
MDMKEVIRRVADGDTDAFEIIVQQYQQKIYMFCYFMLGHRQEAEDAAQEVFFKAYRSLSHYNHESEEMFLAWLYRIASNYCNTLLKRKKKGQLLLLLFRSIRDEQSAEQAYAEQEDHRLDWLAGMTAEEKEILALRVIEDKPFDEISVILDISSATVRKRFQRIRLKLKKNKAQWEGTIYEQRCESQ